MNAAQPRADRPGSAAWLTVSRLIAASPRERVADAHPAVAQQAAAVAEPRLDHARRPAAGWRPSAGRSPSRTSGTPGICRDGAVQDAGLRRRAWSTAGRCASRAWCGCRSAASARGWAGCRPGRPSAAPARLTPSSCTISRPGSVPGARPAQREQRAAGLPGLAPPDAAHQPPGLLDEGVVGAAVDHPVQDRGEDHRQDRRDHQRSAAADPVGRVELQRHHHHDDLGDHAEQHRAPAAERDDADQQQRAQHRADHGDQQHQARVSTTSVLATPGISQSVRVSTTKVMSALRSTARSRLTIRRPG